ncbi:hypothetical protein SPI_01193 [Niveomyces insectorum RCEF 264]|uniref:Uncharacterized protein n=1 Tax=Niveomyces insectorum RCEF 264 TaxID=1081102 RepID=A0A167YRW1_9HYPO|nr:hypothetical protein SPI_01193 [Niveomyces insectorum RCEF 264]
MSDHIRDLISQLAALEAAGLSARSRRQKGQEAVDEAKEKAESDVESRRASVLQRYEDQKQELENARAEKEKEIEEIDRQLEALERQKNAELEGLVEEKKDIEIKVYAAEEVVNTFAD